MATMCNTLVGTCITAVKVKGEIPADDLNRT
jgi:hypothetical protein